MGVAVRKLFDRDSDEIELLTLIEADIAKHGKAAAKVLVSNGGEDLLAVLGLEEFVE